ncbi:cupin domain-containing protein [Aquabacterium sp. A7-Y]|uniref:cupin domain-containing protein n=1 Tax=Aquabacterium sp. A7-Y TaxID=1349605 RepID=UPI00223CD894|nr:cupin domain-containing protein [Aquabacterium sp. A7-Y]MCW7536868.1 cupin domain-containing protein [Aquabacterium sp. A7-Y]
MAMPHAQPLDIISVRPLGAALGQVQSTSLLKTERLQLLHLVLRAHQDQPEHHVDEECTIQCLEGDVEVVMPGGTRRLGAGELVVLPPQQRHWLRARSDSAVLVTLLLHGGDAGHGGGAGARSLQGDAGKGTGR